MKRLLLVTLLTLSNTSFGWGPTGHRVVGEIAQKYINIFTRTKIRKLIGKNSLARIANWPDKIKSDPEHYLKTFKWHYTDWPNGVDNYSPVGNSGSLITSLKANIETLKNKKNPKSQRQQALKFVVHLMGDLHQPLHIGNGLDRGGNLCRVTFQKNLSNLHRVWDADLINFTKLSFSEMAKFINVVSTKEVKQMSKGTILDWARETKDLRESVYPRDGQKSRENNPKIPQPPSSRKYCQKGNTIATGDLPSLGYHYSYVFMPVIEKQLLRAGIRLAIILNNSL